MTLNPGHFQHLQKHPNLIRLAIEFEYLTPENHPDQTGRVALKEEMIVEMANIILQHYIPFTLLVHIPSHGLKAALLRVIGEKGCADHLPLVEIVANGTEPGQPDLNLKWQVDRAYRSLHFRFPDEPRIAASAASVIAVLLDGSASRKIPS
jgi:hypothetical protein